MDGVVYLHITDKYFPFLAVSLVSLRRYCSAPVCILTDLSGAKSARDLAKEESLGDVSVLDVIAVPDHPFLIAINQAKADVPFLSPFERSIYLDSDTIVVGDISALWPTNEEVVLTRRAMTSRSTNKLRRTDCRKWMHIDSIRATRGIQRPLQQKYPPINAGVYGFSQQTIAFHEDVRNLTRANPVVGADEIATQLAYPDYPHRILGREYNGNVWRDQTNPDVVIWHGARGWFIKKPQGRHLFIPLLKTVMESNLGGICKPTIPPWLQQLVK